MPSFLATQQFHSVTTTALPLLSSFPTSYSLFSLFLSSQHNTTTTTTSSPRHRAGRGWWQANNRDRLPCPAPRTRALILVSGVSRGSHMCLLSLVSSGRRGCRARQALCTPVAGLTHSLTTRRHSPRTAPRTNTSQLPSSLLLHLLTCPCFPLRHCELWTR